MNTRSFRLMNDRESYLIEVSTRTYEHTQLFQLSVVGWQNIQQRARELKRALGAHVISSREFVTGSAYQMTLVIHDGHAGRQSGSAEVTQAASSFADVEQLVRFCSQSLGNYPLLVDPLAAPGAYYEQPTAHTAELR